MVISNATVRRHAPLFRNLVRREIRQRYKASTIGMLWTLINPAVLVASYWFVFRYVFTTNVNAPYALFLFVGLAVWGTFMGGVQAASASLVANAGLITKVKFPRQIVPLSAMTGQWFTATVMFVLAVPLCLFFGHGSKLTWIVLPPLFVLLLALTTGFGLLLASINVYFRDVEHILLALSLPWFFLTPVLFSFDSLSAAPQWAVSILHWGNFISPFIITFRGAMFNGVWPQAGDVLYCVVAAVVMFVGGSLVFRRLEADMAVEL